MLIDLLSGVLHGVNFAVDSLPVIVEPLADLVSGVTEHGCLALYITLK